MVTQETKRKTTHLYLDLCAHQAAGGRPIGVVDLQQMLGLKSKGSVGMYVRLLKRWGLIKHEKGAVRAIKVLPLPGYPPVGYQKAKR